MKNTLRLSALAAALAIAWGQAAAQGGSEKFILLTTPESWARVGAGFVDEDGARFGQYRGLAESGAYGLLDAELVRRDNDTGTWLTIVGRNLGLDNREATLVWRRQGHWRVTAAYDQTPRVSQNVVSTGLAGIGGSVLGVQAANRRDFVPETMRKRGTLGLDRDFGNGLTVEVRASSETKEGTRLFGRGNFAGAAVFNFLAEPIDRATHHLDATVGYVGKRVQLQGGYKASVFDSHATSLAVTGGGAALNGAGAGTFSPIALPPGNQAHHVFASGAWDMGPGTTTRGHFKLAYTRATQDERFVDNPPGVLDTPTSGNISGRQDLDGRLDTTLFQAGIGSRPAPKLDLAASVRYEDRDDRTPLARYIAVSGPASTDGFNEPRSVRFTSGRAAAGYQLGDGYKLGLSADLERQRRNTSPVRVVAHRDRLDEATVRVDLRRAFSETLNGTLALSHGRRDGSDFAFTTRLDGSPYSNLVAPVFLADRSRDKARLEADWQATDDLNIQLQAEGARDRYDTRGGLGLGVRRGNARFVALDVQYTVNYAWSLTGWVSHARNWMAQSATIAATAPATAAAGIVAPIWSADLDLRSSGVGFGIRGRLSRQLRLGADLQHTRDRSRYDLAAVTGAPIETLPAIAYDATTLRLWGIYEVSNALGVRLDYEYDRRRIDDWTWRGFSYASAVDGTTLLTDPDPHLHFIALSAYWRWR